ncbi:META domain-containing protein [Cnuibacter sp. UC19_7]|uniref:META domain-containing protein n=1 Tax=Cnuibacter sp. UC19_7 TaxID=3350166 RepID=UPI003672B6D1
MLRRRLALLAASGGALALLVAGCASSSPSASSGGDRSAADAVGTWAGTGDKPASLNLAEDGSVDGTDGCNKATGRYSVEGSQVSFALNPMTLKACLGVTLSFDKLDHGTVDGDSITLYTHDGTELTTLTRG